MLEAEFLTEETEEMFFLYMRVCARVCKHKKGLTYTSIACNTGCVSCFTVASVGAHSVDTPAVLTYIWDHLTLIYICGWRGTLLRLNMLTLAINNKHI